MYSVDEVIERVSLKALAVKKAKKNVAPDYGGTYSLAIKTKRRIRPHYDPDYFPHHLFESRAPNQTDIEAKYIEANHKAVTYVVWDRFKTVLKRMWNDANWSITSWGTVDSKYITAGHEPKKYFEEEYPIFCSLENYYRTVVTDFKEKDPNAVIVHKPESVPVKETTEGYVIDDSVMINPIAYIFECENVVEYNDGSYFIGLSDENSIVEVGNIQERTGLVYEFYDKENIWIVRQVGKKSDYTFEAELMWYHGLGYLPCQLLKAEPVVCGSKIYYKSHFTPAIEPLDMALLDNANLLISKNRHVFPKFWEYQAECEYNSPEGNCQFGYIHLLDGKKQKCPSCNGSGKKSLSVMGTYTVPMPDRLNPETPNMPPGGYINPEIETPKFLDEQIDKNINRGLSILNLNISNSDVKGGDTALGKQIDREEMFSFLVHISSQVFHLFEFSLMTIQKMRYGITAEPPVINYPKNFAIRNEHDLTQEISTAKSQGMPDVAQRQLLIEYLNTRFNNNEQASKIIKLVFYADRLAMLSNPEIAAKISTGTVAKWEDILHTSITQIIDSLILEDAGFVDLEIEQQKEKIIEVAKLKESEISPKKLDANAILANANA